MFDKHMEPANKGKSDKRYSPPDIIHIKKITFTKKQNELNCLLDKNSISYPLYLFTCKNRIKLLCTPYESRTFA